MGIVEFNELKNKHSLGKQDLFDYITTLEEQQILRHEHADEFKRNIGKVFGIDFKKEDIEWVNEEGKEWSR
jgi:hypothetical protein